MSKSIADELPHGTTKSYVVGFILSVVLTLIAFYVVANQSLGSSGLRLLVLFLAVVQLFVQVAFFLHLGKESKPRWNLIVFGFAVMVVFIVVVGSLWIMNNLDYHHETPQQTNRTIIEDEGFQE